MIERILIQLLLYCLYKLRLFLMPVDCQNQLVDGVEIFLYAVIAIFGAIVIQELFKRITQHFSDVRAVLTQRRALWKNVVLQLFACFDTRSILENSLEQQRAEQE